MRSKARKALMLGAGLVLAATMASPAAASEVPLCVGTDGTIVVCVDPFGAKYVGDCVYVGPPPCMVVEVYGPSVSCGGRFGPICDFSIHS